MSASLSGARLARKLLFASFAAIAIAHPLHAADVPDWRRPHDYYATDFDTRNLLKMVEGHHLEQARDEFERGKLKYAKQDLDFILRYFPNDPNALLLMGKLLLKENKHQEATGYFDRAIRMYPTHAATYTAYGVFLHRAGKLREAVAQYQEALKLDPGSAETHYDLGLAYLDLREYPLANQHAHTAYRLGYPLPGLRQRLQHAGKWKPIPQQPPTHHPSQP